MKLFLLKDSLTTGEKLSAWGKLQEIFVKTHFMFKSAPKFKDLGRAARPSWKTLEDRFKKLVADRKTADRRHAQASGIFKKHGEMEQLLQKIMEQVNEKHEEEWGVMDEKTAKELRLKAEGDEMHDIAVNRQRSHSSCYSSKRRGGLSIALDGLDSETNHIVQEMETRRINQQDQQRMEERRF